MILVSTLVLSSLAYHATSALINLNPSALDIVIPHCFTPEADPDIPETHVTACRDALGVLARSHDFITPITYSKNWRRGRMLPRAWIAGGCLIMVNCENDRDAYTFRLADVLVVAKKLVDTCVGTEVDPKWGLLKWGGIDVLGDSQTFYVSVFEAKNHPAALTGGGVVPVDLVNQTVMQSAVKVS